MRNVKVNVQADTSHAIGKVRELTGALAQLDAATKRNVQYLLQALSGAGINPQQIGAVKNQQAATTQAQSQVKAGKVSNTGGNSGGSQGTKTGGQSKDTIDKLNKFTSQTAEAQFNLFAEDLGQMFSKAFSELFQGNIKDALTGLRDSLKGLFNSLLKQLVEDVAGKIRKAITNNLKNLFNKGGTGLNVGAKKPEDAGGKTDNDSGTNVAAPHASPDTPPEAPPHRYSGGHQEGGTDFFDNDYVTDAMDRAGTVAKANDAPKGDPPPKEGGDKGADVGAVTGKFSWGSLGKMVGSMAPALGSSLGGMLGGSSVVGGILGSAGGLIGGTVLSTLLAGGFTGASATGGIFGSIGGAIGLSGVATAGIGIAVAAAFMIGAYILGKNKQRKADEKTRNQAMLDAFSQLDDILKQIQSDQLDGSSGVSQAKNIRSQYMDQVSKLKDKKTRNIALKDVSRIDSKISAIQAAASNQTARKALDAKLVPTFADGGYVGTGGYKVLGGDGASMHPFRGRVPGVYDRRDDFLARLTGNEVVLTPDVWMPIAPYLKQKRVPGFADGGMVQTSGFTGDVTRFYPFDHTVKRYEAHLALPAAMTAWQAFEEVMERAPGWHWQDVNGKITFLAPDRTSAHDFVYDPEAEDVSFNIAAKTFEASPRAPDERINYQRYEFRDLETEGYAQSYLEAHREGLRELQGGQPSDTPLVKLGVMTRSQAERIAETRMKLSSDPERQFVLRGQLDSYKVSKGDRVTLSHFISGDKSASPVECMVTAETTGGNADEKTFTLLPLTFPFYSDEEA